MSLHAHTHDEGDDASKTVAAEETLEETLDALETTVAAAGAEDADATIHIELNFNAFADNVPPTQHARRAPSYTDPSVQDFADQALELAALRAELNRLARDYDSLLHTLALRDARLQRLQEELTESRARLRQVMRPAAAQAESGAVDEEAREARKAAAKRDALRAHEGLVAAEYSATLDLPPKRVEARLENAGRAGQPSPAPLAGDRQLVPVDHEGPPVALLRDIITIGRTKDNDVCIPSKAVSRDHARLLLGPRSVTIVDMNSANGCFVNEQPVKKQKLRHGDVLRIGDRSYRYTAASPHAST